MEQRASHLAARAGRSGGERQTTRRGRDTPWRSVLERQSDSATRAGTAEITKDHTSEARGEMQRTRD